MHVFWMCLAAEDFLPNHSTNLTTREEHTHAPNPLKNKAICKMRKRTSEEMETVLAGIYDHEIQAVATEED